MGLEGWQEDVEEMEEEEESECVGGGMMGENQFHYTLITTYSSGRHLCTDPLLANSATLALVSLCVCVCVFMCVCVCMPMCGCLNECVHYTYVCLCVYPPNSNKINGSIITHIYIQPLLFASFTHAA